MSSKSTAGTPWWVSGDINGFFGLFSNSLANFLTAIGLLAFAIAMPADMVYGKIVPGVAISIGVGNIILAIMAKSLSKRENRSDVTAMPYGLSVPHYFAVALGVILPVYIATQDWLTAWAAGIAWNLIQGIVMMIGAFVGPTLKKYIPRSAMLGALAGLAITLISGNPIGEVFTVPYIGLVCLAILLVGWLSGKKMPFGMPAGAFAILIGTIIAWATGYLKPDAVASAVQAFNIPLPYLAVGLLGKGFSVIAPFLPAAIPLAIYDFLESLDNLESADAAGEKYPVAKAMAVPAAMTIIGSLLGSPFPTIIYIGHPGWKATGARIGYALLTGIAIIILAFTGLLRLVSAVIPLVALLPILVYIGIVIGTQAFQTAKKHHYPAIIFSFMPFIGSIVALKVNSAVGAINAALAEAGQAVSVSLLNGGPGSVVVSNALLSQNGVPFLGWLRLGQGDILIAMMLAAIAIYILDRNYKRASIYAVICAALSFFGIIHSSSFGINMSPQVWLGYVGMAVVLFLMSIYRKEENVLTEE